MRIRSIKPEFWRSRDIAKLDWDTRLVFIGLWSYVDDNGVGKDIDYDIIGDLFASDLIKDPRETVARVSRDSREISTPGTGEQRNRGTEEQRIFTPLYPLKIQNRQKRKNRRTSPPQSWKKRTMFSMP